jgi:CHAT domain-containing protein
MECTADYVVSSYTPTLLALNRARASPLVLKRDAIKLLLVAEGSAPGQAALLSVDLEANTVGGLVMSCATSGTVQLLESPTLRREVLGGLSTANFVHMACHGVQDRVDALSSGFCLHDGRLSISDLMSMNLNQALLAFCSACETAKGDDNQPDQVVHLAAGMLCAGFRSVIATLWYVLDRKHPASRGSL